MTQPQIGRAATPGRFLRLAVASGKGGTGKTTLATNMAFALGRAGIPVAYLDCDVEAPNGHIFLGPTIHETRPVTIPVPEINPLRCTLSGDCAKTCRYSAIAVLPHRVLTFPLLCHGCGACTVACKQEAIHEVDRVTGEVEGAMAGPIRFFQGRLHVGEAMSPPVIRAVLEQAPFDHTVVIDAPPGTSCPVIAAIRTADVVVLVTEPTPFGLNDLILAVGMVRALGIPFGVAVNRVGTGNHDVFEYCHREKIPILLEIPNDRRIAEAYSRGDLAITVFPELENRLISLHETLREMAQVRLPVSSPSSAQKQDGTSGPGLPPSQSPAAVSGPVPRELVVISGKGGTGKTSIVASFFALAQNATVADCDVDAADLHLVLDPTIQQRWPFGGGHTARIDPERCDQCGICYERCRFEAIRRPADPLPVAFEVDPIACEGCGACADACPSCAIAMKPSLDGEWFVSETRHGPMVHARLGIAQENSGKLVSLVRREAKALAHQRESDWLICDGSPGIGCPVIASITGADQVLIVTEPTRSGLHDLMRVEELCRRFDVDAGVCINKADLHPSMSCKIEAAAQARGLRIFGSVRYDDAVTTAQLQRKAVVECSNGPAATDIRRLWNQLMKGEDDESRTRV